METRLYTVDPSEINRDIITAAGRMIAEGGLVAFPTETVYGLGGDATDAKASAAIYAAKGRPSDNPLIVHIYDVGQLPEVGCDIPEEAYSLAQAFWPGPMTIIVKRSDRIPLETTGGLDTVAVRLPSHPVAQALIRESRTYIAAPSANRSGRPSPTDATHVIEDLGGRVDCIIDGGRVDIGLESTIIDLTEDVPTILRPGAISLEDVIGITGQAQMDPGLIKPSDDRRPKAPGMKYRHYAPQGELTIVRGKEQDVVTEINGRVLSDIGTGSRVGIIASEETASLYSHGIVKIIGSRLKPRLIAHNLYHILREFDELKVDRIYSESFTGDGIIEAVANRMTKASGGRIIEV